ncbi:DNA segregation ATPase FtsK/SpoIIIE and related proteins (plasmid) [Tsukamurella tyrosinosolvens]|uniref:FtsK/SpoIIIE family protein n=1 Tax=Tsukamurella tyrosinosolvens TaxID=57704 RepID=A0A1H4UKA6_TSUTY|nr:FtsK/SpoIIIE domain-containing protein [Tsukamurella tyrosinosolvens]KXO99050.1 hypothetical protein AXK58_24150 [Tsukamurella tyrosinosolvens]SEC69117.1 FtsK/SpoIIIE family protein [Tsukamurella tyrosinosolvens]VEH94306.1 DNA segregation ATPase FtsK/SpoIIIE and related proteins [Tsukamurella tyrosinosolvens]
MTRTSNIGDVARRIRDQYKIPLTAGKSIARALAATGALDLALGSHPMQRAVNVAREHGGKITLEQATAAVGVFLQDGKGLDYSQYSGDLDCQATVEFIQHTFEHITHRYSLRSSPEQIAAQWKANCDVEPRLTLGQFQASLGERLALTGSPGTGKSYALQNMLLTLCSDHGPDQVQLLIGESWLPAIGHHLAHLPHTIRAFDHMEDDPEPFLRKLRYELAKRRKLWRLHRDQGDDRYEKLPALLVVLDGFTDTDALRKDVFRVLDNIRGYWDDTSVLMTQHREGARQLRGAPRHWLHFGDHASWMDQTLREQLGHPQLRYFARDSDASHVAIHTARARSAFPSTAPAVSRVVDSPRFDDTFATAMAAGIRAAGDVNDPHAVPPTPRPEIHGPEQYGEDRVPRGAHIHDVLFPGLAVRTVIGTANDPQVTIEEMDLPALLPEHAPGDDALVVVWLKERVYQPNWEDRVWVRAHAAGAVDPAAVKKAVREAQIGVRHPDTDRESALWEELKGQIRGLR